MIRRHAMAATLSIAALTLAACGGDTADEDLTWEDSPMQEIYSALYGDYSQTSEDDWAQEAEEQQRQIEELVATCMADEGFEYIPNVQSGGVYYSSDEGWGTEEWVQQYGYGITTDPYEDVREPIEGEGEGDEWYDPNQEYTDAMSDSERMAYEEALWGQYDEEDMEEVCDEDGECWFESEWNWETEGCYGYAQHEVYDLGEEETSFWEDPAFSELVEAMERLWQDAENDPRAAEINAEWSECMADAGYPGFTERWDAQDSIYTVYNQLWEELDQGVDWEALWEEYEETGIEPEYPEIDPAALAELREQEIATAVADYTCATDLNIDSRLLAIQFELEEEFIETYRTELDNLIAAYGQES